ncbi:MAG: hotdog fold thioesterase [Candidatus Cyclobacteriaceae bacterium M3_2C_046]
MHLFQSSMFGPELSVDKLNQFRQGTISEHLGIEYTEIGPDFLKGRMPVDHRTIQPFRLLHGGASLVMAEELGSMAANLAVDATKKMCVGLEINANHLKSARQGYVYGTARPLHLGQKTQVWEIRIENERSQLTCISRLTMAVLDKKQV